MRPKYVTTMVDAAVADSIGAVGGAVLAACLTPQLYKIWKTRSARDLSYFHLASYTTGLVLTFAYFILLNVTVGWICKCVEICKTPTREAEAIQIQVLCA